MAETSGYSKTEAPTQRRRDEARQKGQVALSPDFTSGILLFVSLMGLWLGGGSLASRLMHTMQMDLAGIGRFEVGPHDVTNVFVSLFARSAELMGWLLAAIVVAGLGISVLQVGFHVAPESLQLQWSRLSPARGWNRLLSGTTAVRGGIAILRAAALATLAALVLSGRAAQIASLGQANLRDATAQGWEIAIRLAVAAAAALVLLGLADYGVQRWKHEQSLRMTRQELKEELKREEGDPLIRARIRRLQRDQARKRMLNDVPRATVVITNPVHLALAIQYERGVQRAPKVIAKGAGVLAERIVERARRHAVPVVERKPLAQALYKAVTVGQEIPFALYYAVAEVLAYVYRLRGAA